MAMLQVYSSTGGVVGEVDSLRSTPTAVIVTSVFVPSRHGVVVGRRGVIMAVPVAVIIRSVVMAVLFSKC